MDETKCPTGGRPESSRGPVEYLKQSIQQAIHMATELWGEIDCEDGDPTAKAVSDISTHLQGTLIGLEQDFPSHPSPDAPVTQGAEALETLTDLADQWISDSEEASACPAPQPRGAFECAEDLHEWIKQHSGWRPQEGSSKCPICDVDAPHYHTPEEQAQYWDRVKSGSMKQINEIFPDMVLVPRKVTEEMVKAYREKYWNPPWSGNEEEYCQEEWDILLSAAPK